MDKEPEQPGPLSGHVLLAEDDPDLRALLATALVGAGFEVRQCTDGMDLVHSLDLAAGAGGIEDYDVVVTDIRMPGVTGTEVLEGLRALGEHCPVILITAFADEQTRALARRAGAAVLDKPFAAQQLLDEVARLLERRRRWAALWQRYGGDAA